MAPFTGSDARSRAGIELTRRTLRYAEVELTSAGDGAAAGIDPGPRLLRLGACDFDFDVERALFDPEAPTHLETVGRALEEIYRGTSAERLAVAVHPWNGTSFFAPLQAAMSAAEKLEQLRQEAGMLADVRLTRALQVTVTPSRIQRRPDGREYHWHHVLHVSEATQARLSHLARQLGGAIPYDMHDSAAGAAELMARLRSPEEQALEIEQPEHVPFALGLGCYEGGIEISVSRGSRWHFSHWASTEDAADAAYFGAALLDVLEVDPRTIRHLFVYGDEPENDAVGAIESLLGTEARPLSPMPLFRLVRSESDPKALAAFAPAVGAALR